MIGAISVDTVAIVEIGGVRMGVFDAVVGADDGHDPELKPCQPLADPLFGPLRIERPKS